MPYYSPENGEHPYEEPRDPLYTEDARDRPPGILTYDDREYLLGEKNVSGASETQLRQRMRDRIRNALLDFELLFLYLDDREIRTIFDGVDDHPWPGENDGSEVYHGVHDAIAFLYHSISQCTPADFERLLEKGITAGAYDHRMATEGPHYRHPNVSVNIEMDWDVTEINLDYVLEKFRSEAGSLTDQELGVLVRAGDLTDEDWERIREMEDFFEVPEEEKLSEPDSEDT